MEQFLIEIESDSGEDGFLFDTSMGPIHILPKTPSFWFSHLKLHAGIGNFAQFSSLIQKLDIFENVAKENNGRVALGIIQDSLIVGYLACWSPAQHDRWSKLGDLMYELGAIEVSREYRKTGLAHKLIESVIEDSFFDNRIAYMNGYSWHWDLDGNHLSMAEYRQLIINLLKPFDFQEYYTNEPNISLRPENVFMARIGPAVTPEDQKKFRDLRFGIRLGKYR